MKNHDERDRELPPDDRRWIEVVDGAFRPEPMDSVRASAFHRRLSARLERRARVLWIAGPALALAAGAAALWLYTGRASTTPGAPTFYAFADPDVATADLVEPDDYLPDDYRALASFIESEPGTE
jgi:hypothetical protein